MSVLVQGQELTCLFFLEPELKFARVINGLASTIKATSITHSAKEAPEASVSCLLFFFKARKGYS